jgi:hypothetical protein
MSEWRRNQRSEDHYSLLNLSVHTPFRSTSNRSLRRDSTSPKTCAPEGTPALNEACASKDTRASEETCASEETIGHLPFETSAQSLCPALLPYRNRIRVVCPRRSKQRFTDCGGHIRRISTLPLLTSRSEERSLNIGWRKCTSTAPWTQTSKQDRTPSSPT